MKIIILGASSYLGARIFQDLNSLDNLSLSWTYFWNKLFPELHFLDITSSAELESYLIAQKPDIVIHCASNANAKRCSENPEQAKLLNITSTKNIIDICKSINCSLIYLSSIAYYFDSLYWESKRLCESYISTSELQYLILRPSLILGSSPNTTNDRPHNRFLKTLVENTETEYDNSWEFEPTYIGDISRIIIHCIVGNIRNTTLEVTSPFKTTRYKIWKELLENSNLVLISPWYSWDPFIEADQHTRKKYGIYTLSEKKFIQTVRDELKTQLVQLTQ